VEFQGWRIEGKVKIKNTPGKRWGISVGVSIESTTGQAEKTGTEGAMRKGPGLRNVGNLPRDVDLRRL